MTSGTSAQADVARGTTARMRVALRPRGRAAGGPHEAQVAHRARTRGKRPHGLVGPWGAPRGRGAGSWRAHGLVGPGYRIGVVTQ